MQDLVSRTALFQMAKDEGVSPSTKDIEDEIAFQKKLDPNFLTIYQRRGLNMGQIREEVRFSLVQERLITKGITVTMDEVDEWLKNNPEATVVPESADLSWILAKTPEQKAQVDLALKNGGKFSEVAVKLSQAPNAAIVNGRYLPERGSIPINKLSEKPPLRQAVMNAAVGSDTAWIQFNEGWAKFHVDAKNPPKKMDVTPERKINIQRNIALQRGNKASDLRKRLVERIKNSDIVVRRDSLKESWKNFADMLRKQADQTTGGTAPAPSGDAATGGDAAPKTTGN
jgi:hypothetical protein